MGYESVHTASATGDDQELRRCIEGLDVDRDGLFNRHDPEPRVVTGRPPGSHGRFNKPTPAAVRGSFGDTPLHKAAMAGQSVALGYLLSVAASGGLKVPVDGGLGLGLDGDDEYRAKVINAAFPSHADSGEAPAGNDLAAIASSEGRPHEPEEDAMQVLARLVHTRNDAGQTALHLAALHGNYTCVQMLIAAKSDVNAADAASGMTPLHAAVRMDHMRVVMLLLDGMADPNAPDLQGGTPLHMAARFDIAPAVRLLAGSGSMLDGQRSLDHYTPLHLSCRYNKTTDTVLALLDARADPTLLSRAGQPPALIAATLGDEIVLEVVSEAHWRLCLENPDGEGLSRIKGGGNLTARALFDKAMQRQCWELSLPDEHGKWYNSTFERVRSWKSVEGELSVDLPADAEGIACGRWVAPGPLSGEALELAVGRSFAEALDLLKAKVGSFTPVEKIEELVGVELSAPARALRTANEHWWAGRRAREEFDFEAAERSFKAAAKIFASDWWGSDGTDAATTLALEMIELKELKADLDGRMAAGDRHRMHFDFKEAAAEYAGVSERFASYGHTDRAFEALYRLKEVEGKSVLRTEAEECVAAAKQESLTATELPEYPHSRLMIMEAVVHLKRACKVFKQYGDTATYKVTKSRLTAAQWNLEKQNKAYAHLVHGNSLMSWAARVDYERKPDTHTVYLPSEDYFFDNHEPKVLMKLQIEEAVFEFRSALAYLADIGDEKVHKLAADNQEEAQKLLEIQREAHAHMQEGQDVETHFMPDANMQGKFLVFGQAPSAQDAEALCLPGREPYKAHAVERDYPFRDVEVGLVYHRKRVREGMEAYRHAKDCFARLPDEENRQEAERQEARLLDRVRTQSEGNRLLVEAHLCVLQRQYADAAEKFKQASGRMRDIDDERNAEYIQALSDDAAVKRGIADTAHSKMRKGLELLELREEFARWEDVVDRGLPAFEEAELLFREASDLFADLDQHDNAQKASERATESLERKTHAQELKESIVIVVQPSGDLAPQRRDASRRTMGYASAIHALRDAATDGYTSTYHTKSEILEGSSVFLRKGVHEFDETIQVNRNVTVRAEDGVVADDCSMTIKNVSLLRSQASSVKLLDVTLNQLLGDGSEDYWSGGLFVVMVTAGYLEATNCFVYSQRGCGVVARHSGKATLINSIVDGCGQYGVGADGSDTIIDLRGCTIEASKFEDTDERNGGRVIGYEEED